MRRNLPRPGARSLVAGLAAIVALLVASVAVASAHPGHPRHGDHGQKAEHVLLLSVDGLHQSDLQWYVGTHPHSALASLVGDGVEFTHAQTPVPSDSVPGMVAQVTGGNPGTTGMYYDETYNRELLPAGTTNCAGAKPGAEVLYTEQADKNQHSIDAGQGLSGLSGNVLQMTGDPAELIDPSKLPVDPTTCKPVYPHEYLRVNTIFEVAKENGLRTAWVDKHPAYDLLQGPSDEGIEDLFTPEINSDAPTEGSENDWTTDNALTEQYDGYKVQAVINEIKGFDHSGTEKVGTPAIFGMNFQTVSTAEKLPESDGLKGGYEADGTTPAPLLRRALGYVNTKVGSDAPRRARKGPRLLDHGDLLGQARPVPGHAVGADPDPRRADPRRARRSVGHRSPRRQRTAGRLLDRRRRDADLAPLPDAGSAGVRQVLPAG